MDYDCRKYSFTWKIKNFSLCSFENSKPLVSPTFTAESIGGSEWMLSVYPRGINKELNNHKFISCYLKRIQNDELEKIDFNLEMMGPNDEILESGDSKEDLVTDKGKGWPRFIAIDELNKKMENWEKDILIINCFIFNHSNTSKSNTINGCEVWTTIGVDRCYFEWNVKFLDYVHYLKDSKSIFVGNNFHFEFTLTASSDEVEINIRRLDKEISESKCISCKISLLNLKNLEVESKTAKHLFEKNVNSRDTWKFPNFITKKMLLDGMNGLMQNNTFTLKCELSVSTGEYLSEFKSVKYEALSSNASALDKSFLTLHGDLRNMIASQKYSDIMIHVGNTIIPAHKLILSARSPVFNTMFDQDMVENYTGVVRIEDVDAVTFNYFLEYIYTGTVKELEFENAKALMIVADKYQVSSLIEKCYMFLTSKLSVENVCEVYTLANFINHQPLKSSAFEYIEMNSTRVLSTQIWRDWMKENVELAIEILYKLALEFSP